MTPSILKTTLLMLAASCSTLPFSLHAADNNLNILNWSELVSPETQAAFSKQTGIKLHYDILDSDDTLEGKLLAGNSGFDVVYPSSSYMVKQVKAGAYAPIDWSKIPNRVNLDPALMQKLAKHDPDNRYGVPFLWGTDGMLVNVSKVQEILGKDFDLNSWDLLFKPEVVSQLKSCGVSVLDSPQDVFQVALKYMGRNPNSENPDDYKAAYEMLKQVWPNYRQVNSTPRDPVARGEVCVAMAWSGDAGVMQRIVGENQLDMEIRYITPKNQTPIWGRVLRHRQRPQPEVRRMAEQGLTDMSEPVGADGAVVEVTAKDVQGPGVVFCPNPKMTLWSGHPRVFIDVATTGEGQCPYCGTRYRLKAGEVVGAH